MSGPVCSGVLLLLVLVLVLLTCLQLQCGTLSQPSDRHLTHLRHFLLFKFTVEYGGRAGYINCLVRSLGVRIRYDRG